MSKYPLFLLLAPFLLASCFSAKNPAPPAEKPITCGGSGVVAPGAIITLSYTGKVISDGRVFDATTIGNRGPRPMKLGTGQFPTAFDRAIVCMKVGESKSFTLMPEQAYGRKMLESEFVKTAFGTGISSLKVGSEYSFPSNMKVKIVKIGDQRVTVEQPNPHPLAGESLNYDVKIELVR